MSSPESLEGAVERCPSCGCPNHVPVRTTKPSRSPVSQQDELEALAAAAASAGNASCPGAVGNQDPPGHLAVPSRRPEIPPVSQIRRSVSQDRALKSTKAKAFASVALGFLIFEIGMFFLPWVDDIEPFRIVESPASFLTSGERMIGTVFVGLSPFIFLGGLVMGIIAGIKLLDKWECKLLIISFSICVGSCMCWFLGWQFVLVESGAFGGSPGQTPWFYLAALAAILGTTFAVMANRRSYPKP